METEFLKRFSYRSDITDDVENKLVSAEILTQTCKEESLFKRSNGTC